MKKFLEVNKTCFYGSMNHLIVDFTPSSIVTPGRKPITPSFCQYFQTIILRGLDLFFQQIGIVLEFTCVDLW